MIAKLDFGTPPPSSVNSNDALAGPQSGAEKLVKPPALHPSPPSPPPSHIQLQALVATSTPLLNLVSQAPQQGADATFSSTLHPSHFPRTHQSPTEPCGQIRVKDKVYTILKILFTTKGLVGRGTVCYLVSMDGEEYIIKDHWVQGGEEKVLNEINMLKAMSGVPCVPELVDDWLGTIPFMSHPLLAQMAELQSKAAQQEPRKSSSKTLALPPSHVSQSFGDDLESLFYVFAYVCIKYSGPNGRKHQESVPDSLLDSWLNLNLDTCKLRKVYFFAVSMEEAHLERQFHPYFTKLIPLAKEWRAILRDNMET
ncbi:hypothetical protein P692DRAFT_20875149 [Suillus brevipes Sb2]|nr:hypothetical protein P692DRAFT_20875149 [Suillus brevipes Sb2]